MDAFPDLIYEKGIDEWLTIQKSLKEFSSKSREANIRLSRAAKRRYPSGCVIWELSRITLK
jgi:hypothetical protein